MGRYKLEPFLSGCTNFLSLRRFDEKTDASESLVLKRKNHTTELVPVSVVVVKSSWKENQRKQLHCFLVVSHTENCKRGLSFRGFVTEKCWLKK